MNKYLFKDKYRLILYIILAPLSAACEVGLAYAMASALDYVMTGELGEFGKYVLLYLIYICLSVIADRLTKKIFFKVIGSAIVALKNDVNKHIISMRYCDFQKKSSAEYMTLLTTKVETLRNSYYMPLLHLSFRFRILHPSEDLSSCFQAFHPEYDLQTKVLFQQL